MAPSDPLYSLSLSILKTAVTASAAVVNGNLKDCSSSGVAADVSGMSLGTVKNRQNNDTNYEYDEEKDRVGINDYPLQEMSETVGGVWMPRIG